MSLLSFGLNAAERGLVPDPMIRRAIRRLCDRRLSSVHAESLTAAESPSQCQAFLRSMHTGPVALVPEKANEQHYELPPQFFNIVLGPRRKYSCCFWPGAGTTLADAETESLRITCERARLSDGQQILELGCGWGSLSLWMAERYPKSGITAVSNSLPQRRFIESQAASRGLANLTVITADMNEFSARPRQFDRVVSVEMFEHMRNYELLLQRIASWLREDGHLFVHHFCHRTHVYPYETEGISNWMGRYFFTGGLMPAENILRHFDRHLKVVEHWQWKGTHYQRTADAWLANLDAHRPEVMPILATTYGRENAKRWFYRWRLFFLAVAELFGHSDGAQWFVSHSLLKPHGTPPQ